MAAQPAGGATRAAWSSGEAGLSQKPRLPARKVTLEAREFGRDGSRTSLFPSLSHRRPHAPGWDSARGPQCQAPAWGVGSAQASQQRVDTRERERVCVCARAEGHVSRAGGLCCVALGPALCLSEPERGEEPALCQGPEKRHVDLRPRWGETKPHLFPSSLLDFKGDHELRGGAVLASPLFRPLYLPCTRPLPASPAGWSHPLRPFSCSLPTPTPSLSGSPSSDGPKTHGVSGSLEGAARLPHRQEAGPARRAPPPPALRPSRCDLL